MNYLAQQRPKGCRNWQTISKHKKAGGALAAIAVPIMPGNAYRVRVIEIMPPPKNIAAAFYGEPRLYFEGKFP